MGSDTHYPEEAPAHPVTVDGFWMDRYPVTNEAFARFVEETGHVTFAEIAPDPADYPGALPEMLYAASLVFHKPPVRVALRDMRQWWEFPPRRAVASSVRRAQLHRRDGASSGGARGLRRRRGVRAVGGQGAADGGGVGARRARRSRGRRVRVGRRADAGRAPHGERVAGRVSVAEHARRRLRAHVARGRVPAQRLRPARPDRQRVGVDDGLVPAAPSRRAREGVLHPAQSARRARGVQLRSVAAGDPHPAQGAQGRLAPVRAELLPPLPAGGALSRSRWTRRRATWGSGASCASSVA